MEPVSVTIFIHAPIDAVFGVICDFENLPDVVPDIVSVKIQSDIRSGVGTRYRETRSMRGKKMTMDMEVSEYTLDESVRIVNDSHGTVWDTLMSVVREGELTRLEFAMEARAHSPLPRMLNPLMKGLFRKGMQKQIEAVKTYCERT